MSAELEDRGLAPLIVNLVKPTVDLILGMEAKTRRDWVVTGETSKDSELAEALSVKLKEAEKLSRADRACSDAYAHQVKVGMGWVEVTRELDPFLPPYRVKAVHRREIWWDWRAKDPLLQDARYLLRKQWYDKDQVIAVFPEHKDLIRHAVQGFTEWDYTQQQLDQLLVREWQNERDTSIDDLDWRDTERERLAIYECWYKVWHRGYVMDLPNGVVLEYDDTNPRHREVLASGQVRPRVAVFTKVRLSWWIGPHRIIDVPNPFPFNGFPYIPFFGFREDRTGVPYGMVRAMKSPQDEFNARRRKMMWYLAAKRVITDSDAVKNKDHEAVMQEVGRPDAYIELNENRLNKSENAFRVEDGGNMARDQFLVMNDAADRLQSSAGVFQEQLGKGKPGQSGIAVANLVEQGTTTLGEINDNYQFSRQRVGEHLMHLVKEDLTDADDVEVRVQHPGKSPTTVYINRITEDAQGRRTKQNDISRLRAKVGLAEVPSTPTFRQQQLQQLSEVVSSLPPELQALVIDMVVEATDLPMDMKKEVSTRLRKASGVEHPNPEEMDEQERQAYEQEMQQKAEDAERVKRMQEAEVLKTEEEARKVGAEADAIPIKIEADAMAKDRDLDMKALGMIGGEGGGGESVPRGTSEDGEGVSDAQLIGALRQLQATMGRLTDQVDDVRSAQAAIEAERDRSKALVRQYIAERGNAEMQTLVEQMS
jgi:hypothetical protein